MAGFAEAQGDADDEYMAMDAEQWMEQDDIYENGDTIGGNEDSGGRDPGPFSRGKVGKDSAANNRILPNPGHPGPALPAFKPLSDRYQTIRWHTNRAQGQKQPSHQGNLDANSGTKNILKTETQSTMIQQ